MAWLCSTLERRKTRLAWNTYVHTRIPCMHFMANINHTLPRMQVMASLCMHGVKDAPVTCLYCTATVYAFNVFCHLLAPSL